MRDDRREAGPEPPSPDDSPEGTAAGTPTGVPEGVPASPGRGPDATGDEAAGAEAFSAQTVAAERLTTVEPDYKDRWLRAEAEIQNTRRRAIREREEVVRASEERILLDMVEVLDDLERALAALEPGAQDASGEGSRAAWAQGVALTAQRLRDALARHGVSVIPTLGEPFDPALHEALLEVPAPEGVRPGAVAQEVQKGYRRGGRALRAARVVVARADG